MNCHTADHILACFQETGNTNMKRKNCRRQRSTTERKACILLQMSKADLKALTHELADKLRLGHTIELHPVTVHRQLLE